MKQIANLYSFDASSRRLAISGLSIPQARLLLVVNASRNEVLYNFAGGPGATSYAIEGGDTVLLLTADTTTHADTDALTIFYDDGLSREESLSITDLHTVRGSQPGAWLSATQVPVTLADLVEGRLPVDIGGGGTLTITSGTVTVQNEVEVKNDEGNPIPVGVPAGANLPVTGPLTRDQLTQSICSDQGGSGPEYGVQLGYFDEAEDAYGHVSTNRPLPVVGSVMIAQSEVAVTGPLTDTQLRASALGIRGFSGSLVSLGGTASLSSQEVLPASTTRRYLLLQNISSGALHVNFGSVASTSTPRLDPGASFVFEGTFVPQNSIHLLATAANQKYCILYFNQ